jgi:hypothetical protein
VGDSNFHAVPSFSNQEPPRPGGHRIEGVGLKFCLPIPL